MARHFHICGFHELGLKQSLLAAGNVSDHSAGSSATETLVVALSSVAKTCPSSNLLTVDAKGPSLAQAADADLDSWDNETLKQTAELSCQTMLRMADTMEIVETTEQFCWLYWFGGYRFCGSSSASSLSHLRNNQLLWLSFFIVFNSSISFLISLISSLFSFLSCSNFSLISLFSFLSCSIFWLIRSIFSFILSNLLKVTFKRREATPAALIKSVFFALRFLRA